MLSEVQLLGAMLRDFGVNKGDVVILYMPMVPEAVFAMLACARIGAIHSVVFGGFAAKELATRIDDCQAEGDPVGELRHRRRARHSLQAAARRSDPARQAQAADLPDPAAPAMRGDARRKAATTTGAKPGSTRSTTPRPSECVPVAATDPLYILYTSGTTGIPKGVVRDNGGHLVALKWSMQYLYGVNPGEVWWSGSDVGWVVGHSYIVYAPLFHGCTSILYEGKPVGTPDAGAFWRVCADHGVVSLFTAPTAFRAIRKEDPDAKLLKQYDLSKFRALFLAGERADPPTIQWAEEHLKVPVLDHWWQTETGWCIAGNPLGLGALPVKYGSACVPMPGYAIDIVDEACHPVPAGKIGSIVVKLPLPPANFPTLWQQDDRFKESYLDEFPGYYKTADAGYKDDDGYVFVMSRTDDIINVAGHRLSTGGMEEVLAGHPDVAECAVLGIKDELKGEVPCGFIVLKAGVNRPPDGDREGDRGAGAREDRPGGGFQIGDHGRAPAEDALRKNFARHHQEDRRRR